MAARCCTLGRQRYGVHTHVQRRFCQTFGIGPDGKAKGVLNQQAQAWAEQSLQELGAALKTSFKLKANPFKNPKTADEWEPYLEERKRDVNALARQLADAIEKKTPPRP